ncbi:XdhC family protein [Shewanella marina]|uniref:XdhC family protein n=1 Tax=Shewanella marina TaxID=487319 RepID=UPI000B2C39CC|nr:XdhC family protein [Shewanella marina]
MSIFEQAAALEQQNIAFAIASIIETKGSSPRHSGKMLVKGDGNIIGTIGGGMIERYVIEQSLEAINEGSPRTVSAVWLEQVKMPWAWIVAAP